MESITYLINKDTLFKKNDGLRQIYKLKSLK